MGGTLIKEGQAMTDFQFRSIIKMVLKIVESSKDMQEVVNALKDLLDSGEEK